MRYIGILFLISLFTVLMACEEEETVTTYQVVNNLDFSDEDTDFDFEEGTLFDTKVFHFKENGDMIGNNSLGNISPDESSDKKEIEGVDKVKVGFYYIPDKPEYESIRSRNYTGSFFYLEEGSNKKIEIDGETMMQETIERSSKENKILEKQLKEIQ